MSKIVAVGPTAKGTGQVRGDVRVVALDCGHTFMGNPIFVWRPGDFWACSTCRAAWDARRGMH
jgi:hypothetical protein